MTIAGRTVGLMVFALACATRSQARAAAQNAQLPAPAAQAPRYTQQTPEQLQQLAAPIALYPDSLVAQILSASTFPEQIVQAERWAQAHPEAKGEELAHAVDQQPWDPSVKALTTFPSVLGNMDKNLSWTSSLGDAYYNQPQDVMDAVQVMRLRAQKAGTLATTSQQVVSAQGSTVVIEPANPEVVYVPAYDPWVVYGGPIGAWPGWNPYPGIWYDGPYLSFGAGFGIGFLGGYGWGSPHWGFDWRNHYATFNQSRYNSRSTTFYNRTNAYRTNGAGGDLRGRANGPAAGASSANNGRAALSRPPGGGTPAARGFAVPRGQSGVRSGAFSGYGGGGQARGFSSRGSASAGGGGRSGGGSRGGGRR